MSQAEPAGPSSDVKLTRKQRRAARRAARPPWDRFWLRAAASALTGVFMVLGVPETSFWWLGFFAWVPLLWAIEGLTPRRALLMGLICGQTAIFFGFFWMTELLTRFAGLPQAIATPIHFLFAAYHGLMWAIPAMLIAWLRQRGSVQSVLFIAPAAWAVTESFLPNIFPTFMALMWCFEPAWIQTAELGGVATVGFIMLAINAAIYEAGRAWFAGDKAGARRPALLALAIIVATPIYGAIRISQIDAVIEASPKLRIGAVQGNFGIHTYTRGKMKRRILAEMQRVSRELEADGAQLVVWGETAYPYLTFGRGPVGDEAPLDDPTRERDRPTQDPRRVRRGFDIPIIFGAITVDESGQNPYPWNTAFAMNGEGEVTGRYDKNYPLVFGEYIPIVDPEWFMDLIPSASHLNRGEGPELLEIEGHPIGTMICYEDILPHFTRETVNAGASALVNLTNDSWFGKTREQAEHLGLAVFRSVEHRRGLVRVVNAGISAYVDPVGRVVAQTEVTDSDVDGYTHAVGFNADVPMIDPEFRTLYGYTGPLFAFLCLGGLIFVGRRRGERKANQSPPASTNTENKPQTAPHIQ